MDDLGHLRKEIGQLDRAVLETLNRRLELVRRVNAHKKETGTPLIDAEREAELLRELSAANAGPLSERAVQTMFAAVLDVMKQELREESRPLPPAGRPEVAAVASLAIVGTRPLRTSLAPPARRPRGGRGTRWGAGRAGPPQAGGAESPRPAPRP